METRVPGSSGLLGSLRGFADSLIGSAHDRLELLAVELHEEKYRLIQIFIWISAIVFLVMLATVFASFALVNAHIGADSVHLDTQSPGALRGSSVPQDAPPVVAEPTQAALGDSNLATADNANDHMPAAGAT